VDLRGGGVLVIDVQTAEKIVKELIEHLKDKEELKRIGKRVPGPECRRCGADCKYRKRGWKNERKGGNNPLKTLQLVLKNIDAAVEEIATEVLENVEKVSTKLGSRVCSSEVIENVEKER